MSQSYPFPGTGQSANQDHPNGETEDGHEEEDAVQQLNAAERRQRARNNWMKVSRAVGRRRTVERVLETLTRTPAASLRRLCGVCNKMELTPEKFKVVNPQDDVNTPLDGPLNVHPHPVHRGPLRPEAFDPSSGKAKFHLGLLRDIWERSKYCPFCSLVIRSAQEQTTHDVSEDTRFANVSASASWLLDGREIEYINSKPVSTARTRRIRIEWAGTHLVPSSYIVFVPEQHWVRDHLFMGRHAEGSQTNLALIKSWIDLCQDKHGPACKSSEAKLDELRAQPYFAVIDVNAMRLSPLPPRSDYIALSYTWGNATRFTTSLSNVANLRKDHGLNSYYKQFPRAIKDAITLTRNLGKQFLWVDALCIVQNSPRSFKLNARIMDQVYGNSYLTICAADNPDADAGLIGLDPSRRHFRQFVEEVAPKMLQLEQTRMDFPRANAVKEMLVVCRRPSYFQCGITTMSEDIIAEREGASWSIELAHAPLQMLKELKTDPISVYTRCVNLYTQRQMSKVEDILSAFTGISNRIAQDLDADFIFGLPNSHFDWALLWEPKQLLEIRIHPLSVVTLPLGQAQNYVNFPSWSWCGWVGNTHYKPSTMLGTLTNLHEWLTCHTWIIWYIRDGYGKLRLVRRSEARPTQDNSNQVDRWAGYPPSSLDADNNITLNSRDIYGRRRREELPDGNTFHRVLPDFPFSTSKAEKGAKPDNDFPDMQWLQFWTCQPGRAMTNQSKRLKRYGIADRKGDWCGTVVLDKTWDEGLKEQEYGATYEFLALSEAKEFSHEEYDDWNYYIQKERDQSEWDLYYVLLIEHNDEGYEKRVGLGKVYKDTFDNSFQPGKQWKEFILG